MPTFGVDMSFSYAETVYVETDLEATAVEAAVEEFARTHDIPEWWVDVHYVWED